MCDWLCVQMCTCCGRRRVLRTSYYLVDVAELTRSIISNVIVGYQSYETIMPWINSHCNIVWKQEKTQLTSMFHYVLAKLKILAVSSMIVFGRIRNLR